MLILRMYLLALLLFRRALSLSHRNSYTRRHIPPYLRQVFERIAALTSETVSYKVEVSYMEIYNEKVRR